MFERKFVTTDVIVILLCVHFFMQSVVFMGH